MEFNNVIYEYNSRCSMGHIFIDLIKKMFSYEYFDYLDHIVIRENFFSAFWNKRDYFNATYIDNNTYLILYKGKTLTIKFGLRKLYNTQIFLTTFYNKNKLRNVKLKEIFYDQKIILLEKINYKIIK